MHRKINAVIAFHDSGSLMLLKCTCRERAFFFFMEDCPYKKNYSRLEIYIRAVGSGTSGKTDNLKCLAKFGLIY